MIILGIDPGSTQIGFGLVEKRDGNFIYLESGLVDLPKKLEKKNALPFLEREVVGIIKKFRPAQIGLEKIFFIKNKKTAVEVIQARGVIMNAAIKNRVPVIELTPSEVKLAVAGYGLATKKMVAKMVSITLSKPLTGLTDDITDALAIAIAASNKQALTS